MADLSHTPFATFHNDSCVRAHFSGERKRLTVQLSPSMCSPEHLLIVGKNNGYTRGQFGRPSIPLAQAVSHCLTPEWQSRRCVQGRSDIQKFRIRASPAIPEVSAKMGPGSRGRFGQGLRSAVRTILGGLRVPAGRGEKGQVKIMRPTTGACFDHNCNSAVLSFLSDKSDF
jgi:hypothetical protein